MAEEKKKKEDRAVYRKQVCYDDKFKEEMDDFQENIKRESIFSDEKHKAHNRNRFSRAIRHFISTYNKQKRDKILEIKGISQEENPEEKK